METLDLQMEPLDLRAVLTHIAADLNKNGQMWKLHPDQDLLISSGTPIITFGEPTGHPRALWIEFVLDPRRYDATCLSNIVAMPVADPAAAARSIANLWVLTTGSAVMEALTQKGDFGSYLDPADNGVPGWHAFGGHVTGWGEDVCALGEWLSQAHPWTAMADLLNAEVDRDELIGVKFFVATGPSGVSADVFINGAYSERASAALAALPMPSSGMCTAQAYLLLVHRAVENDHESGCCGGNCQHDSSCGGERHCDCGDHGTSEQPCGGERARS